MSETHQPLIQLGSIVALWRYPVKSMQGEKLRASSVSPSGLLGDRAYALVDQTTGRVASAKHPRLWRTLLNCHARFVSEPQPAAPLPPIAITLPDGTIIHSSDPEVDDQLSHLLGRAVKLVRDAPAEPTREADRTPLDVTSSDTVIQVEPLALAAPDGTLFDYAPLHLLTSATLRELRTHYPAGDFAITRFRPNIVITPPDERTGFVENEWIGRLLELGGDAPVNIHVIDPCPRCVVTTLPQNGLPHDPGILRTVAHQNAVASATLAPGVVFPAVAGVYAQVQRGGTIAVGDVVRWREAG